jgi:hypothetical protein
MPFHKLQTQELLELLELLDSPRRALPVPLRAALTKVYSALPAFNPLARVALRCDNIPVSPSMAWESGLCLGTCTCSEYLLPYPLLDDLGTS